MNNQIISTKIWYFFASIKLAIFLLLTLAATSIIGTIIPQSESLQYYEKMFGSFFSNFIYFLGIFDVYHSTWFRLLILLLCLNIIICSVEKLQHVIKIVRAYPSFQASKFRSLKTSKTFLINGSLDNLKHNHFRIIAKKYRYCEITTLDNSFCIYAEKGRWTRLGVYAVHISVIFMLVGGLIGSIFGFEGYINILEGESANQIALKKGNQAHKLPFTIRCDKFSVSFYDSGQPKEYKSKLTILKNNKEVIHKEIVVNQPLRYKGINIFQSNYGVMPKSYLNNSPNEIILNFENKETHMIYEISATIGSSYTLPEGAGTFTIKDYKSESSFGGHDLGPTLFILLSENKKSKSANNSRMVIIPLKYPNFDKMRQGEFVISVSNSEDFLHNEDSKDNYYTGLQVTSDPGVLFVYSGFFIMLIGIYITFFMAHERIFLEANKKDHLIEVFVSGSTNKNKLSMKRKILYLSDVIKNNSSKLK